MSKDEFNDQNLLLVTGWSKHDKIVSVSRRAVDKGNNKVTGDHYIIGGFSRMNLIMSNKE